MFVPPPVERMEDGRFEVRLSGHERALLRGLPVALDDLIVAEPADPSLRRLFPPAYEDTELDAEYQGLMGAELLGGRRASLLALAETVDREHVSEDELHAWLSALNDLRLVLGTRLGVTEETYEDGIDEADPQADDLALYAYLTWLQDGILEALT
jgi:uncharacterized protein DUF2017